jgi:hypothetical protein
MRSPASLLFIFSLFGGAVAFASACSSGFEVPGYTKPGGPTGREEDPTEPPPADQEDQGGKSDDVKPASNTTPDASSSDASGGDGGEGGRPRDAGPG